MRAPIPLDMSYDVGATKQVKPLLERFLAADEDDLRAIVSFAQHLP